MCRPIRVYVCVPVWSLALFHVMFAGCCPIPTVPSRSANSVMFLQLLLYHTLSNGDGAMSKCLVCHWHVANSSHCKCRCCGCAQDLSKVAWSFAKLGYFEQGLWDALAATTIPNVKPLHGADLAQLTWAFCQAIADHAATDGVGQYYTLANYTLPA